MQGALSMLARVRVSAGRVVRLVWPTPTGCNRRIHGFQACSVTLSSHGTHWLRQLLDYARIGTLRAYGHADAKALIRMLRRLN
jgi:hypothetical protein